jgi:hypothetical protein
MFRYAVSESGYRTHALFADHEVADACARAIVPTLPNEHTGGRPKPHAVLFDRQEASATLYKRG